MILTLFCVCVGIAFLFLFLGYFFDKNNRGNGLVFVRMTGWIILFLVSVNFIVAGIDYKDGMIEIQETPCEWYINETCEQSGSFNMTITTTYVYENYTAHTTAVALALVCAFGFISCFFDLRGPGGRT